MKETEIKRIIDTAIDTAGWSLFRVIIPVFPELNIFSKQAERTTALGPIMIATAANMNWGWRAEVIDENNYKGPRDKEGLPDHRALQKDNPAIAVGFYCGLSSTIERVWKLAEFYQVEEGAFTIAGGWHAHYCPEETLVHNIDVVVHGDGEEVIGDILKIRKMGSSDVIPGISFWKNKEEIRHNSPKMLAVSNLNCLPYPDFGLVKYAKLGYYPISRIRGCSQGCEFCSVTMKARWASPEHLFKTVDWLVAIRKAKKFFMVDDRLEEDLDGTIKFFSRISEKYGNRLKFTVQTRLETAENKELIDVMRKAGVRVLCIGYESPIDEDLKAMRKGYDSSQMLKWTKVLRRSFWIHGMFIIGYPWKDNDSLISAREIFKRFKTFIRKVRLDTIQILLPTPLVGTVLRKRLKIEERIIPAPWSKYDGNFLLFKPENIDPEELQKIPMKLMRRFYDPLSFFRGCLRTIVLPVDYFIRGWRNWHWGWSKDWARYFSRRLVKKWMRKYKKYKI